MAKKTVKQTFSKIIDNNRTMLETMQETGIQRGEQYLDKLLHTKSKDLDFPVPPFVPFLLIWLFVIIFPLSFILDPNNIDFNKVNAREIVAFYLPLLTTTIIFLINQKYFVPNCFFKHKHVRFFLYNVILVFGAIFIREVAFFLIDRSESEGLHFFITSYCFSSYKGHFSLWNVSTFFVLVMFECVICVLYSYTMRQIADFRPSSVRRAKKHVLRVDFRPAPEIASASH